ncbi:hypothetical protein N9X53_05715 [Mariniblastus sp.]|jgi:hypothetical protein|nr:hypothetical protein [Mariniblastus sp.]
MNTPDQIKLKLDLPGLPELAPLVKDFASRALDLAEFTGKRRDDLLAAFLCGVELVERTLAHQGDAIVPLEIGVTIDSHALEFKILEHGIPLGGDLNEDAGGDITDRIRPNTIFDRLWWVQKGRQGSELHLYVKRDHASIEVLEEVRQRLDREDAENAHADTASSDMTGEYRIRDYREGDGLEVARRIYEAYGRSYPNPDLYVPDRIDLLNREGRLHSIICESPNGDVVGHYALERPDLGPIGEAGQAVIDHRHRGHGLMKPMRAAVERAGAKIGLLGIWSQPTARHPISQRMNLKFGSTPTGLCLGTTPADASLRGGVAGEGEEAGQPARHSCFLYWDPITEEPKLRANVPAELVPILSPLYEARKREVSFETNQDVPVDGHAAISTRFDSARGVAWVSLDQITSGAFDGIWAAIKAMETSASAATVFVDLPIDDPGCGHLTGQLLSEGLRLAGVGPRFRRVDDDRRAEDVLRLQLNPGPVDLAGLVVEGDLGRALADTVIGPRDP